MPGMIQPERQINIDPASGDVTVYKVKSLFSSEWNTLALPRITREQWDAWQGGQHIQHAMPHLSPAEREFLLTGATPEEWDAAFPEEDDDD